jgi:hypothetical protein
MIKLPDYSKSFEYENNFYLSCDSSRMSKVIAHYELYKMSLNVPGAIVECGVFKGASLVRFAMFRELLNTSFAKKIIGFDAFGKFPVTRFKDDRKFRKRFIETSGEEGISKEQLTEVLDQKGIRKGVELIAGDVNQTVPKYLRDNPELKISLLNMDTDVYEPAVTILKHLYPRITRGGILIIDDYGVFPGETKAVDDFFKGKDVRIQRFPYAQTPCFVVKND